MQRFAVVALLANVVAAVRRSSLTSLSNTTGGKPRGGKHKCVIEWDVHGRVAQAAFSVSGCVVACKVSNFDYNHDAMFSSVFDVKTVGKFCRCQHRGGSAVLNMVGECGPDVKDSKKRCFAEYEKLFSDKYVSDGAFGLEHHPELYKDSNFKYTCQRDACKNGCSVEVDLPSVVVGRDRRETGLLAHVVAKANVKGRLTANEQEVWDQTSDSDAFSIISNHLVQDGGPLTVGHLRKGGFYYKKDSRIGTSLSHTAPVEEADINLHIYLSGVLSTMEKLPDEHVITQEEFEMSSALSHEEVAEVEPEDESTPVVEEVVEDEEPEKEELEEVITDAKAPLFDLEEVTTGTTKNVVFVVDTSGSMNYLVTDSNNKKRARIALLKEDLTNHIQDFKADVKFNIIAFDHVHSRFAGDSRFSVLMPATTANKKAAIQWVSRLRAGGGTRIDKPLMDALKYDGVETVYLLTDGMARQGCMKLSCIPLARTRTKGIVVHTTFFAPGDKSRDATEAKALLQGIATASGGKFYLP